jgi:hypothetical protein
VFSSAFCRESCLLLAVPVSIEAGSIAREPLDRIWEEMMLSGGTSSRYIDGERVLALLSFVAPHLRGMRP